MPRPSKASDAVIPTRERSRIAVCVVLLTAALASCTGKPDGGPEPRSPRAAVASTPAKSPPVLTSALSTKQLLADPCGALYGTRAGHAAVGKGLTRVMSASQVASSLSSPANVGLSAASACSADGADLTLLVQTFSSPGRAVLLARNVADATMPMRAVDGVGDGAIVSSSGDPLLFSTWLRAVRISVVVSGAVSAEKADKAESVTDDILKRM